MVYDIVWNVLVTTNQMHVFDAGCNPRIYFLAIS